MTIRLLESNERNEWNAFISTQFAPVGAFLQTYEWGEFKKALHGEVQRFAIEEDDVWLGCFQMETHSRLFGLSYGYAPRGPVLKKDIWPNQSKVNEIFTEIATFLKKNHSHLLFVRFEPPYLESFSFYNAKPFTHPERYLQPRFNQLVTISAPETLIETFSNDVKHDLRAAERLGIYCESKDELSTEEQAAYEKMKSDTAARSGKSIFPSDEYFKHLIDIFSPKQTTKDLYAPRLRYFVAKNKAGEAVAINLNILFPNTLTYLFGASYSGSASKRAPAYLHWSTMKYAFEKGYNYYDLGGVDDSLWHGLTYFKRQFGGETLEYVGTVDIVFRAGFYSLYNFFKQLRA